MDEVEFRFWQLIHNAVAHPIEGVVVLFTGKCPEWVERFHDWTAVQAWRIK